MRPLALLSLILFIFFAFLEPAKAQDSEIFYLPYQPSGLKLHFGQYLPLEMWQIGNQSIRSNLGLRLNTFPFINRDKFQLDLGPGQILIRITL